MNEFIIWDKENYIGNDDRFYTPSDLSLDGFYLQIIDDGALILTDICDDGEYTSPKQIAIETFNYIGKTDIEGNKIYADSSIVKVSVFDDCSGEETVYVDYVTFDKKQLRYVLSKSREFNFAIFADEIEIIGTLQEKPELMEQ